MEILKKIYSINLDELYLRMGIYILEILWNQFFKEKVFIIFKTQNKFIKVNLRMEKSKDNDAFIIKMDKVSKGNFQINN